RAARPHRDLRTAGQPEADEGEHARPVHPVDLDVRVEARDEPGEHRRRARVQPEGVAQLEHPLEDLTGRLRLRGFTHRAGPGEGRRGGLGRAPDGVDVGAALAATAAATAPSTSGASARTTRSSSTRSRMDSAVIVADPRSVRTTTPSSPSAVSSSSALATLSKLVPIRPSTVPPAALSTTSVAICAATSHTPRASCAEWDTTRIAVVMTTPGPPRRRRRRPGR